MRMSFGKYGPQTKHRKGIDIAFINSGYLRWLMKQYGFVNTDSDLVLAIEEELKYRDQNNCHFYEDKIDV